MADFNHNGQQDDNILLHLAVIEDKMDVAKFLLKHGVHVTSRAANKQLALEFSSDTEHQKYINETLDDISKDPESDSIEGEKLEATLVKTTTALHLAARSESTTMAELLLLHGAEINAEMEGGETPLIVAVLSKRQNAAEFLLDHGADVNARTCWGKSALHYAAQMGQKSMVEMLLKRGANGNAPSSEGNTALHLAAEAGYKESVGALLKNGVDFAIKNKKGASALHLAIVRGHKEVVELILAQGADVNSIMKNGELDLTPFDKLSEEEAKKAWELVSKYTNKMSIFNWYSTMVTKLCKKPKDKKGVFPAEAEKQQLQ